MRLTVPDRNEFLKAALKATDVKSLTAWVVSLVDTIDNLPEGRNDTPCPPYRPTVTDSISSNGMAAPHGPLPVERHWENTQLG